ncbi:MAG: hypothetical protein PHC69_08775, partial [Ruminiclostridium sp.]|nr:hypothetical protein [Ruminiclostridium sp.]
NSADGIDYMVAVASGILAGVIDSFWVGEFNFKRGKKWGNEETEKFVNKIAKSQGYNGDENNIKGSITFLEKKYGLSSDSNKNDFGGGLQHHLRDFAHHPTFVGLLFSLLTQLTEKAYGTDVKGLFIVVDIKDKKFIGKNLPEKILFGVVYWFFHLISDMAGSSLNPGAGTGLPGPLLSFAKELSSLPIFNKQIIHGDQDISISQWISKLFNGTLLAERDSNGKILNANRFDLRAELGVALEIGRQAIPVIINESIVRGFYFIRRLTNEIKEKKIGSLRDLDRVDWKKTLPWNNRTIARMLTISMGTFTIIDLGDAAIRGGIKSAGNPALFANEFLLRVNVVGVGRFAVAFTADFTMGVKRNMLRSERISILSSQLHLMNAKVYYLQASMWKAAQTTEKTINEVVELMEQTTVISIEAWKANRQSMENIGELRHNIEKHNPGIVEDISDILKWG